MNRRRFLQNLAVATASIKYISGSTVAAQPLTEIPSTSSTLLSAEAVDTSGHTLVCEFKSGVIDWKVYEDLRARDGALTFVSSAGKARVLGKHGEPAFDQADKPYLGLELKDVGTSPHDLLADKLLQNGDPDPEQVKSAAPPQGTEQIRGRAERLPWDNFVGTRESLETEPVLPNANTETYHPVIFFPEITGDLVKKRFDGLVGGWMPAARKVFPVSDSAYVEVIVFADVKAPDKFIVNTWHRSSRVEDGKVTKVVYGDTYVPFPPRRGEAKPEDFYRAMLAFAEYWDGLLHEFAPATLPQNDWVDMSKHAFVKELMVRPGGIHPRYGAVDFWYRGPECDGFQDIFTMATYANLEWGRFQMAHDIIDDYLTNFTDSKGMINMRGPETAQFGMTLSLLARYYWYTRDHALLEKHGDKIEATVDLLNELHAEGLKLPQDDPGYGLIHGWSESDSCLSPKPMTWWLPYYSHNAWAARGMRDLSNAWLEINRVSPQKGVEQFAGDWLKRSKTMQDGVVASMRKNLRSDMNPPYIGTYPGTTMTFWESMQKERPSPQGWPHRGYAELLQADVIPADLANAVIDCMRAYGATTLGIVANVEPPHPTGRDILGFISYGYAQMLLRLDRIEEYLLFLYAHRYHDHTRGSWTAGEVSGITGGLALFCIPAQQTIPLLVRWMLVLEDSDEDRLYFAKGLPRDWAVSGKEIRIQGAPTRWGRVNFKMLGQPDSKRITATVELAKAGAPKEIQVKFRVPAANTLQKISVNGKPVDIGGPHKDCAIFKAGVEKHFEVVAELA